MESVPTITIDFTDGVELYLGKQSLNVEIISSKSSSINVSVPAPNGDYVSFQNKAKKNCVKQTMKTTIRKNY